MLAHRALALAALTAISAPATVGAQELADICLKNGIKMRARVEPRDGRFFLYLQGNSTASDMTGQISSVGMPDDPVCRGPANGTAANEAPPPKTVKFGIRGSNTIGERLMPMLIDAYANKTFGAPPAIRNIGPEELEIELKSPEAPAPAVHIDFQSKGSGTAPPALKDHLVEIGMMSRRMKPEEGTAILGAQGADPLDPRSNGEHVIALDGLAVIVNPGNPIKKLSLNEIARIFSGEASDWRDVHGKTAASEDVNEGPQSAIKFEGPIQVHARDNKSGTFDTFKALVLEGQEPKRKLSPQAVRYESSETLSSAVAKDAHAIGFIAFPYINRNKPLQILSPCGLDSEPEEFSVKMETYPLARRLFLYTLGTPKEPIVHDLLAFALSDEAQKTVVEAGFIDQAVSKQPRETLQRWVNTLKQDPQFGLAADKGTPALAGSQFSTALSGLQRTSIVFRFAYGESVLDTLARQNTGRLGRYLARPEQSGSSVVLAGFADSEGTWASNIALANSRARAVLKELENLGLRLPPIKVASMSYMAPVACNDSEKGRSLNRRVEVWISNGSQVQVRR